MKRRTFLKKTTGAGGVVLSSLAIGTGFSTSELLSANRSSEASDKGKSPIRVGVITQKGGPHLSIYLKALAASEGLAGLAISDESGATFEQAESSLGQRFPDLGKFRDYRNMIDEFKPQMVLISLEAHLAPDRIRKALEGNCSVLAEKPACVRAEDFEPLVELAESRNLHLMLALPGRLHPSAIKAKELIRSGFLGKLYGTQVFQVKDQTRLTRVSYHDSWFAFKNKAGGGHLIWLGIHNLDLIQYLADDPIAKVSAVCRNVGGQPVEIEDAEALAFQFKSGMVGTFHGGYYLEQGGTQSALTIWGSKGWLRMSASRHKSESQQRLDWQSTHPDAPEGIQTIPLPTGINSYQLLVQAAIKASAGTEEAPLTGRDCLQVLRVIFGAYRSSETGREQSIG